jgi:hypothetical protein
MESQMERIGTMLGKIFVLSLLLIILERQGAFSQTEDDSQDFSANEIRPENAQNNQALMYRMLNSNTKDPEEISSYRRWKKEQKLRWLSDHKNLMTPGMINDEEIY